MENHSYVYLLLFILFIHQTFSKDPVNKPNVIVVVADDLGYTDVGFHHGEQIPTPNIDSLAHGGIIMDNYYTHMICTPSRASLLTGRHPMQLGLQNHVISQGEPWGLGLEEKLLPQLLKSNGYATHAIGKWHLGSFTRGYTPTYRGFDSFFGFWGGKSDYFKHIDDGVGQGLDFWEDTKVADQYNNSYGTELFGNRAVEIINKSNQSQPFFMYLAHQAVHNALASDPLEAPQSYIDKFSFIKHKGRRIYAAMLTVLDESIGNLTRALKASGQYNNTVIIFTTDNGGPVDGFSYNYASDWPLRGCKYTNWEGGVRAVSFIHSPLLKHAGTKNTQLMHVSDWFPTILDITDTKPDPETDYYGMSQWQMIQGVTDSPRVEVLHNFWNDSGAIRLKNFKLVVVGYSCCTHSMNGWYPHQGYVPMTNPYVACGSRDNTTTCTHKDKYCLFDIAKDPCEYNNIASQEPQMAAEMHEQLMRYDRISQPPRNQHGFERANPKYWGGHYTDWKDPRPFMDEL